MQGRKSYRNRNLQYKKSQGFGIIEVLIALVILSIGSLALVRTQIGALQVATDAGERSMAALLLQDMVARIQANSGDAIKGLSSAYLQAGVINNQCLSSAGNICSGAQMAVHDVGDWNQAITNAFPAGTAFGLVCLEASPGSTSQTCSAAPASNPYPVVFTVKIFWKSTANRGGASYDQSLVTTVEPVLTR